MPTEYAEDLTEDQSRPKLEPKVWTSQTVAGRAYAFVYSQLEKELPDHQARINKWIEWDNVYRLVDRTKPTDGGCTVSDPEPQIQIDVMKANFLEAFFSSEPNFEYAGQEDSDREQAEIMTAYRADHLRRIDLRDKFERSLHQWLVYGTAICKDPWRKEVTKRKVRERNRVFDKKTGLPKADKNGNPVYKTQTTEKDFPKWDDTDWEYVSMYDFIPVGKGYCVEDLMGVIHRTKVTWDHLKSNERQTVEVGGKKLVQGIYYNLDTVFPVTTDRFDLVEYWGRIPKSVVTGKDEDRFITFEGMITCVLDIDSSYEAMLTQSHSEKTGEIAELEKLQPASQGCIRIQENPFWHGERPFRLCPYTPVDNELYGIGMIEPMTEKWHELNTTIRQLVDNKTLQLLNPTIEDVNANVQRDVKLVKFPRIKAEDVNGVQPLPLNDFSQNGWRIIAALKDDMRRASGALEALQGVPLKDERVSATEFQGTFQQAGVRLKARIRLFDEKMFKKFLDRSYQNDMQFAEFERIVRVVGKKGSRFQRVKPEDIWGTFDIITHGPLSFENKVIKTNKLTNFFAIAAKAPQFANIPKLLKQMYVKMEIGAEHEADEIVLEQTMETSEDVAEEIEVLGMGQRVEAGMGQNHQLHIQMKVQATKEMIQAGLITDESYSAFEDNVNQHIQFMEKQNGGQAGLNQVAQNGAEVPVRDGGLTPVLNPTGNVGANGGSIV